MAGPTIRNGSSYPINYQLGTVPDVSGAMLDYFQLLSFTQIAKTVTGFEVSETPTVTQFWGVAMPYSPRELKLLPEGERAWSWWHIFSQTPLELQVDDVILIPWITNEQLRVMSRNNMALYGYFEYTVLQDWSGSGP